MEKKVTKEEVERALSNLRLVSDKLADEILTELFPFKIGDKVMVIGKSTVEARSLNGDVVEIKNVTNSTVSTCTGMYYGMHLCEVRHATPEEIAAAEWEEGKLYKVFIRGEEAVRVSSSEVGKFYSNGFFSGHAFDFDKYEKL